ncbi:AraC family transcriptional regulator [Mammaliicoccus sciuri]|uniref:helix-turn-helix domain-containing protein n=1 Tax=Mammaliicoccus sciuri TaxID=1296 RepID=UPI0021D04AE2|nr:AraC family transcriptional regulator [Mammaliicoccus sciuri]UXU84368.1 AraC family transcriptional regulator [Mammaliicoccus sciuri]UXU94217.1 AraC family transcriptional regulator [Mammaliicoccus sciuri]UXV16164.1 AraC family transcriptional regulator [Mammaliicoccus sciuri]UXV24427.1 AraC family transcriptional regulator [Mammaliicoccus sciuri]UXV27209.1 AraC family transcriptional regulator [Mammaliicoccus sciuri]
MLYDSNLKIYQPLNIQSDFNMGLLLLFVIEGSSKIYINGKKEIYQTNDIVIINDLEHYRIYSNEDTVIACLYLSRCELDYFFQFEKKYYIDVDRLDTSVLKYYMNKVLANYIKYKNDMNTNVFNTIKQLMMTLRLYRIVDEDHDYYLNNDIHKAINYMHDHYKEKLYIAEVATNCILSVRWFSENLEEITDMKYRELRKSIRLSYAIFDLIYSKKSITQIAGDNGFAYESNFIASFRDKYHITPAKYRKQLTNDQFYPFNNKRTNLIGNLNKISHRLKDLTNNVADYISLDIHLDAQLTSKLPTSNLLIYIRNIETLTNNFQQSKLLTMRREIGQYGLLFSHHLLKELLNESNFENNKLMHQMFSFSLEHQFEISFELNLSGNENLEMFEDKFKRLLNYLIDCTYYYGQRQFHFYLNMTYYQYNHIYKMIKEILKDSKVTLILNDYDKYLANRMTHILDGNKPIACKVYHELVSDKEITTVLKNNSSLNILYQPTTPNRIESLIETFKWCLEYKQRISIIIDDTWIDSMIPSQSSHLMIKELQLNKESQYQLFELILTLKRLRGNIVFFNDNILVTHYLNEYQLLIFPNNKLFNKLHQKLNITGLNIEDIEYRIHDICIKRNKPINQQFNEETGNKINTINFDEESRKLVIDYDSSADVIKHIYIKQKIK